MNLAIIQRYKDSVPFSQRLNHRIYQIMKEYTNQGVIDGIDYTSDEGFDTLENITKYYKETNRLMVWNGASGSTIFGDSSTNLMFRAWHDLIHILNQFEFTTEGESMTAFKQVAQLPTDWGFERELILVEVIGQVLYNTYHNGDFPVLQRQFTLNYLLTGDVTKKY